MLRKHPRAVDRWCSRLGSRTPPRPTCGVFVAWQQTKGTPSRRNRKRSRRVTPTVAAGRRRRGAVPLLPGFLSERGGHARARSRGQREETSEGLQGGNGGDQDWARCAGSLSMRTAGHALACFTSVELEGPWFMDWCLCTGTSG
jgi:hypothetical protein